MMKNNVTLIQSRDLLNYKLILEGLVSDFGYVYYHAILSWCKIIDDEDDIDRYWQVWIIRNNDETIGICGLYSLKKETDELWLGWFGIIEPHRNNGIGTEVLSELEIKAKEANCKTLYTYVDKAGKPLNFYYRNGFQKISTVAEYIESADFEVTINSFENPDDYVLKKSLMD